MLSLNETLHKMYDTSNSEEQFKVLVENMKVKASKGMIPHVSSEDIDIVYNDILLEEKSFEKKVETISEEIDEVLDYYNCGPIFESLRVTLSRSDASKLTQLPLSKLLNYSTKDIKADIKDKDNGKTVLDYRIPNEDKGLTLARMVNYICQNGNKDDKEAAREKLDSFKDLSERIQNSKKEEFTVSYGSVKGVYNIYKKVYKRVLKEEDTIEFEDLEELNESVQRKHSFLKKVILRANEKSIDKIIKKIYENKQFKEKVTVPLEDVLKLDLDKKKEVLIKVIESGEKNEKVDRRLTKEEKDMLSKTYTISAVVEILLFILLMTTGLPAIGIFITALATAGVGLGASKVLEKDSKEDK